MTALQVEHNQLEFKFRRMRQIAEEWKEKAMNAMNELQLVQSDMGYVSRDSETETEESGDPVYGEEIGEDEDREDLDEEIQVDRRDTELEEWGDTEVVDERELGEGVEEEEEVVLEEVVDEYSDGFATGYDKDVEDIDIEEDDAGGEVENNQSDESGVDGVEGVDYNVDEGEDSHEMPFH